MIASDTDDIRMQFSASRQRLMGLSFDALASLKRLHVSPLRSVADISVDISRQWLDDAALSELLNFAEKSGFAAWRQALLAGEPVNQSEKSAALHMALRATDDSSLFSTYQPGVQAVWAQMASWVERLHSGRQLGATGQSIRHLVHIGIGGSHLGPELACRALNQFAAGRTQVHYVANMDASALSDVLRSLPPEQTLFVLASKSFRTREVLVNLHSVRSWLLERGIPEDEFRQHLVAVTAHPERAQEEGIASNHCLSMPEWVGGRYSLWSAVGLSVAVHLGMEPFMSLLRGAHQVDCHFFEAPPEQNVPLLLALIDLWNGNVLGLSSQAVIPYCQRLDLLAPYLQQLQMESNGKSVSRSGEPLMHRTSSVLWGGVGTNSQHAYHQLLHQGTETVAVDFLMLCNADSQTLFDHQQWLVSACLGQAQALACGNAQSLQDGAAESQDLQRLLPGGKPSSVFVLPDLTPSTLGQLLALFEHRVFCQSILWQNNPFDQFGVEHGKHLADAIYHATDDAAVDDKTTSRLLKLYLKHRGDTC